MSAQDKRTRQLIAGALFVAFAVAPLAMWATLRWAPFYSVEGLGGLLFADAFRGTFTATVMTICVIAAIALAVVVAVSASHIDFDAHGDPDIPGLWLIGLLAIGVLTTGLIVWVLLVGRLLGAGAPPAAQALGASRSWGLFLAVVILGAAAGLYGWTFAGACQLWPGSLADSDRAGATVAFDGVWVTTPASGDESEPLREIHISLPAVEGDSDVGRTGRVAVAFGHASGWGAADTMALREHLPATVAVPDQKAESVAEAVREAGGEAVVGQIRPRARGRRQRT